VVATAAVEITPRARRNKDTNDSVRNTPSYLVLTCNRSPVVIAITFGRKFDLESDLSNVVSRLL
jgi:hypothetical protein